MSTAPEQVAAQAASPVSPARPPQLLRFATAGSVDDGKSTLIGRLLYDAKSHTIEQVESASRSRGDGTLDLALLTDGLRAEREQGITIDVAYRHFATPRRRFIIADTPGHAQYTRNMVTGASTADLAVVLVDAREGLLTQSRRHAAIAGLLGIPRIVLAVNKMDLVGYDEDEVVVLSSGARSRVVAVDNRSGEVESAGALLSVAVQLADELDVARGALLVRGGEEPRSGREIDATVCWLGEAASRPRGRYLLKHTTSTVRAVLDTIHHTLEVEQLTERAGADSLSRNEIGRVTLRTSSELYFDRYADNRTTGSFILIDEATNETVGAGMVDDGR